MELFLATVAGLLAFALFIFALYERHSFGNPDSVSQSNWDFLASFFCASVVITLATMQELVHWIESATTWESKTTVLLVLIFQVCLVVFCTLKGGKTSVIQRTAKR